MADEAKQLSDEALKALKDSINGVSNSLGTLNGALRAGTVSADDMAKTFRDTGGSIPVLGSALGMLGSALNVATEYIGETNNMYNTLAKSGAGLSGSIFELRSSFNESRMSIDQFTRFAQENSQQLAAFAGGVSQGTKRIGEYGKALNDSNQGQSAIINQFMNLGYSIDEATEFTTRYLATQQRSNRMTQMTAQQEVAQAAEYAKQLKVISALTGKSAKQMQDEQSARLRDGATRAALMKAEKQAGAAGANVASAYTEAQTALQKSPKVMQDLLDDLIQTGVPMSEATQNFAAVNGEAYNLLVKAAQATKAGDVEEAQRLTEEAAAKGAEFAQSEMGLTIATLSQVSDVAKGQADALAEMGPIIDAVRGNMDDLKATTGESVTFLDAWNKAVANSIQRVTDEASGLVAGTNMKQIYDQAGKQATDAATRFQENVGDTLANQDVNLGGTANTMSRNTNTAGEIVDNVYNKIGDLPFFKDDIGAALNSLSEEQKKLYDITEKDIEKYNEYMKLGAGDTQKKADIREQLGAKFFDDVNLEATDTDIKIYEELKNLGDARIKEREQQLQQQKEETVQQIETQVQENPATEPTYGIENNDDFWQPLQEWLDLSIDELGKIIELSKSEAEGLNQLPTVAEANVKVKDQPSEVTEIANLMSSFEKEDQAKTAEQNSIKEQVASLGPEMKSVFEDLVAGNVPRAEDYKKIIEENGSESFDKIQDLALQMRATYTKDYSQVATEPPQLEVASMPKDVATEPPQLEVASMPKDPVADANLNVKNLADNIQGQSNTLQKSIDTLSMQIGQLIGTLEGPTTLASNQPTENNMEKQLVSLNNNVMALIGINTQTMNLYKRNLEEIRSNSTFA
jgi:hypothetical protein